MEAVTQSGYVPGSPGSGSLTETSYCFHAAATGKALQRPWPWAQFTCSGSALKNAPAQELLPEGNRLALKVTETWLVQFRVSAYYLAYVK